jgi:hypothetical protein
MGDISAIAGTSEGHFRPFASAAGLSASYLAAFMKRSSLVITVLLAALPCAGCSHIPFIGKKKQTTTKQKLNPRVATEVEKDFESRWVEKRSAELVSQGQPEDAARTQAVGEFKQKFAATSIAQTLP